MMDNEVLSVIRSRRTLRRFSDREVEPQVMDAVIDAALRAPTASNMMYYSIIHVTDDTIKQKLQATCNGYPYIGQAPQMLIFCADYQKWEDYFTGSGVREKCSEMGKRYLEPCERNFVLCCDDALLAAQNAVIAAESLGLGSCFIGHITSHCEEHRALLNLPPLVTPIVMLLLGYPQEPDNRRLSPRFARRYIVHENAYHRLSAQELEEMTADRFAFVKPNRFGAENKAQNLYLSKYDQPAYRESARSMHEAMKPWRTEDEQYDEK